MSLQSIFSSKTFHTNVAFERFLITVGCRMFLLVDFLFELFPSKRKRTLELPFLFFHVQVSPA